MLNFLRVFLKLAKFSMALVLLSSEFHNEFHPAKVYVGGTMNLMFCLAINFFNNMVVSLDQLML